MKYDYLIVGSGFFGATFARLATDAGKKCLVLESRSHIAGNAYTRKVDDIDVHVYGAHIFHTSNDEIWNFVNRFAEFNNYVNSPKAYNNGRLYSLPFNMNTFYELWGCTTPEQAKAIISSQQLKLNREPKNLEEQALSLVGTDIYELIIKEYTQKQWQRHPCELPADIIKRLPIRYTFNDNYFNDRYQGIPVNGYTNLFERMLDGIEVKINTDYLANRKEWNSQAEKVVFTGRIDEFFDFKYGELEYRTLKFDTEILETDNHQGTAVINYPDLSIPYTRIIEHRHFKKCQSPRTVITKEIPTAWDRNQIPYYPINDDKNNKLFDQYQTLASRQYNTIFGGRLAEYKYYDMHQVIGSAMKAIKNEGLQ